MNTRASSGGDRFAVASSGGEQAGLVYWIVRDEGDALAYWGPYSELVDAQRSGLYYGDVCDAIVALRPNPDFALASATGDCLQSSPASDSEGKS